MTLFLKNLSRTFFRTVVSSRPIFDKTTSLFSSIAIHANPKLPGLAIGRSHARSICFGNPNEDRRKKLLKTYHLHQDKKTQKNRKVSSKTLTSSGDTKNVTSGKNEPSKASKNCQDAKQEEKNKMPQMSKSKPKLPKYKKEEKETEREDVKALTGTWVCKKSMKFDFKCPVKSKEKLTTKPIKIEGDRPSKLFIECKKASSKEFDQESSGAKLECKEEKSSKDSEDICKKDEEKKCEEKKDVCEDVKCEEAEKDPCAAADVDPCVEANEKKSEEVCDKEDDGKPDRSPMLLCIEKCRTTRQEEEEEEMKAETEKSGETKKVKNGKKHKSKKGKGDKKDAGKPCKPCSEGKKKKKKKSTKKKTAVAPKEEDICDKIGSEALKDTKEELSKAAASSLAVTTTDNVKSLGDDESKDMIAKLKKELEECRKAKTKKECVQSPKLDSKLPEVQPQDKNVIAGCKNVFKNVCSGIFNKKEEETKKAVKKPEKSKSAPAVKKVKPEDIVRMVKSADCKIDLNPKYCERSKKGDGKSEKKEECKEQDKEKIPETCRQDAEDVNTKCSKESQGKKKKPKRVKCGQNSGMKKKKKIPKRLQCLPETEADRKGDSKGEKKGSCDEEKICKDKKGETKKSSGERSCEDKKGESRSSKNESCDQEKVCEDNKNEPKEVCDGQDNKKSKSKESKDKKCPKPKKSDIKMSPPKASFEIKRDMKKCEEKPKCPKPEKEDCSKKPQKCDEGKKEDPFSDQIIEKICKEEVAKSSQKQTQRPPDQSPIMQCIALCEKKRKADAPQPGKGVPPRDKKPCSKNIGTYKKIVEFDEKPKDLEKRELKPLVPCKYDEINPGVKKIEEGGDCEVKVKEEETEKEVRKDECQEEEKEKLSTQSETEDPQVCVERMKATIMARFKGDPKKVTKSKEKAKADGKLKRSKSVDVCPKPKTEKKKDEDLCQKEKVKDQKENLCLDRSKTFVKSTSDLPKSVDLCKKEEIKSEPSDQSPMNQCIAMCAEKRKNQQKEDTKNKAQKTICEDKVKKEETSKEKCQRETPVCDKKKAEPIKEPKSLPKKDLKKPKKKPVVPCPKTKTKFATSAKFGKDSLCPGTTEDPPDTKPKNEEKKEDKAKDQETASEVMKDCQREEETKEESNEKSECKEEENDTCEGQEKKSEETERMPPHVVGTSSCCPKLKNPCPDFQKNEEEQEECEESKELVRVECSNQKNEESDVCAEKSEDIKTESSCENEDGSSGSKMKTREVVPCKYEDIKEEIYRKIAGCHLDHKKEEKKRCDEIKKEEGERIDCNKLKEDRNKECSEDSSNNERVDCKETDVPCKPEDIKEDVNRKTAECDTESKNDDENIRCSEDAMKNKHSCTEKEDGRVDCGKLNKSENTDCKENELNKEETKTVTPCKYEDIKKTMPFLRNDASSTEEQLGKVKECAKNVISPKLDGTIPKPPETPRDIIGGTLYFVKMLLSALTSSKKPSSQKKKSVESLKNKSDPKLEKSKSDGSVKKEKSKHSLESSKVEVCSEETSKGKTYCDGKTDKQSWKEQDFPCEHPELKPNRKYKKEDFPCKHKESKKGSSNNASPREKDESMEKANCSSYKVDLNPPYCGNSAKKKGRSSKPVPNKNEDAKPKKSEDSGCEEKKKASCGPKQGEKKWSRTKVTCTNKAPACEESEDLKKKTVCDQKETSACANREEKEQPSLTIEEKKLKPLVVCRKPGEARVKKCKPVSDKPKEEKGKLEQLVTCSPATPCKEHQKKKCKVEQKIESKSMSKMPQKEAGKDPKKTKSTDCKFCVERKARYASDDKPKLNDAKSHTLQPCDVTKNIKKDPESLEERLYPVKIEEEPDQSPIMQCIRLCQLVQKAKTPQKGKGVPARDKQDYVESPDVKKMVKRYESKKEEVKECVPCKYETILSGVRGKKEQECEEMSDEQKRKEYIKEFIPAGDRQECEQDKDEEICEEKKVEDTCEDEEKKSQECPKMAPHVVGTSSCCPKLKNPCPDFQEKEDGECEDLGLVRVECGNQKKEKSEICEKTKDPCKKKTDLCNSPCKGIETDPYKDEEQRRKEACNEAEKCKGIEIKESPFKEEGDRRKGMCTKQEEKPNTSDVCKEKRDESVCKKEEKEFLRFDINADPCQKKDVCGKEGQEDSTKSDPCTKKDEDSCKKEVDSKDCSRFAVNKDPCKSKDVCGKEEKKKEDPCKSEEEIKIKPGLCSKADQKCEQKEKNRCDLLGDKQGKDGIQTSDKCRKFHFSCPTNKGCDKQKGCEESKKCDGKKDTKKDCQEKEQGKEVKEFERFGTKENPCEARKCESKEKKDPCKVNKSERFGVNEDPCECKKGKKDESENECVPKSHDKCEAEIKKEYCKMIKEKSNKRFEPFLVAKNPCTRAKEIAKDEPKKGKGTEKQEDKCEKSSICEKIKKSDSSKGDSKCKSDGTKICDKPGAKNKK